MSGAFMLIVLTATQRSARWAEQSQGRREM
jgi:hypothetical protein